MPDEITVGRYEVDGGLARITLNRPDKRNALNDGVIAGLKEALNRANQDAAVRVIVLKGAGKDFCAGADLSALQKISEASMAENAEDARSLLDLFALIRSVKVPVIAAVRGRALAGGCGLASACDLVVASDNARFGYPEVKLGFVPAMVTTILRRHVSEKRAFELLTRGDEISAQEARVMGLINHVFADADFEKSADDYARRFEKLSASAVSLTKSLLYQIDGMSYAEALQTGADVNVIARMTEDCQQGIAGFLKRNN